MSIQNTNRAFWLLQAVSSAGPAGLFKKTGVESSVGGEAHEFLLSLDVYCKPDHYEAWSAERKAAIMAERPTINYQELDELVSDQWEPYVDSNEYATKANSLWFDALTEALTPIAFCASPWGEAQTIVPRWMRASKRLPSEVFDEAVLKAVLDRNNHAILAARCGTQGGSGRHNKWAPAPIPASPARKAERAGKKAFNRAWNRARLSGVGADLGAVLNRVTSTTNNNLSTTPEVKALSKAAIARLARRAARKADRKAKRAISAAIKAAETPKTPETPKGPKAKAQTKPRANQAEIAALIAAIKGRKGLSAFIGAIQNNPESTINNLTATSENLSADFKRCTRWVRRALGMNPQRFELALASKSLTITQELEQAFWDRFVRVAQPVGGDRIKQINAACGSAK